MGRQVELKEIKGENIHARPFGQWVMVSLTFVAVPLRSANYLLGINCHMVWPFYPTESQERKLWQSHPGLTCCQDEKSCRLYIHLSITLCFRAGIHQCGKRTTEHQGLQPWGVRGGGWGLLESCSHFIRVILSASKQISEKYQCSAE